MFEEFRNILFMLKITGGINGRKRFQKEAYLLKEAGFPFEENFEWNNFGPFSTEFASKIDALCKMGWIHERVDESTGIKEFSYQLTTKGMEIVETMKKTETVLFKHLDEKIPELNKYDTSNLEKIASIKFLLNRGCDLDYTSIFLEYTKDYKKKDVISGKRTMEELFNAITI